jgi:cytidylate kinase
MIIAVDGPAASGKGTLARRIADAYGLRHLDTGLIYRAVGRDVLARGASPEDADAALDAALRLDPESLSDPALRAEQVGEAASIVSARPQVRAALLELQRRFARTPPGAVLDGRDIGTVVCPDADVKLFVTASLEARAVRRRAELAARGEAVALDLVREELRRRDERDASRASAPMRAAVDAVLLDTTDLDIEAAFEAAVRLIDRATRERAARR